MSKRKRDNPLYKGDSPEQIQMCLNCPREQCVNCLSSRLEEHGASTKRLLKLKELCETANLSDKQMGEILGVTLHTVGAMRKKLGIPILGERKRNAVRT